MSSDISGSDEPFFRRQSTLEAIESIRSSDRLVIYAGAGATIDKSDLTWNALIEGLLQPHIPDQSAREKFVRSEAPLFAASAAAQFFLESSDEVDRETDARQRIVDTLRPMMYGPGTWRSGALAPSVADFVYLWNTTGASGTASERSACVVTTNYDDYIYSALKVAYRLRAGRSRQDGGSLPMPKPKVIFPSDSDPLVHKDAKLADWIASRKYPSRDVTACIHLHGLVPKNPRVDKDFRQPVVSENDYYRTATPSEQALVSLLDSSDVVIVGASMTDAPLIRALEATTSNDKRRYCLTSSAPLNSRHEDGNYFNEQRRMITARLAALNVIPIFVDYYVQQAQFFRELASAAELSSGSSYSGSKQPRYYYNRITRWWRRLGIGRSALSTIDMQLEVHDELMASILPQVRAALTSGGEHLKLEIWLRWEPSRDREFRLFGSSVGIWATEDNMRSVAIATAGNLIADAFQEGRPILRASPPSPEVRWLTWLAVPIWSEAHETAFVSSVMVLASRSSLEESALNVARNRAAIANCVEVLQEAGTAITDPENWKSD